MLRVAAALAGVPAATVASSVPPLLTRRSPGLLLSARTAVLSSRAGEPRMVGRAAGPGPGGVNLPDLDLRSGDDFGDQCGGETVHWCCMVGGLVPAPAEEVEEQLLVRRLWGTGGVPMLNCTLGGDMETRSGAGEQAETRRVLPGNCLEGERGEEAGLWLGAVQDWGRGRRSRAGLGAGPTVSSSGSGPSVEPPLALLTPDMADTELRSPASPPRLAIREFCKTSVLDFQDKDLSANDRDLG